MQYRIIKNPRLGLYRAEVNIVDHKTSQPNWKPCESAIDNNSELKWFGSIVDAKIFAEKIHQLYYSNKEQVIYEFNLRI